MPATRIPADEAERRFKLIGDKLRAGHPPPGTGSGNKVMGAVRAAAVEDGMSLGSAHSWYRAARTVLGRDVDWSQWKPAERKPVDTTPEGITKDQEIVALKDVIRDLENQIKSVHRDNATAEAIRKEIFKVSEVTPKPPSWLVSSKPRGGHAGVPVTIWSDWHWGEVVSPQQVNGVNEFDMSIARARLKKLVAGTINLCRNHMTGADYPGIVVNLGGDMVSGDIHEELSATNDEPMMPVLVDLFEKLIWAINTLADEFGKVFLPCVAGNHGRTSKTPNFKNRAFTNFDWLLYTLLDRAFQNDDRVRFQIPAGADATYRVFGHRFMLTHGDNLGVRGGDGIIGAIGPIIRGSKKVGESSSVIGLGFDTLLMGHWHQYMPLRSVVVNGSLKGFDEFAQLRLRAVPEAPVQGLFFVHPDHGITCHWPVHCADKVQQAAVAEWVSWAKSS